MNNERIVFFISDRTGVTVENLGHSLLTQFNQTRFSTHTIPFVDSFIKTEEALSQVLACAMHSKQKVIVFSSLVDPKFRTLFEGKEKICHIDFFNTFIPHLEKELSQKSSMQIGLTHGINDEKRYDARMEAVNFALNNDDGITEKNYDKADIILIGVSRSGKTPTCLYLALQYGILVANYPLTAEDLDALPLPNMIKNYRNKLFGLTIDSQRLHRIREERRPDSTYASLSNCDYEVRMAETLFNKFNIPYLSSTNRSVEELAANIFQLKNLHRKLRE